MRLRIRVGVRVRVKARARVRVTVDSYCLGEAKTAMIGQLHDQKRLRKMRTNDKARQNQTTTRQVQTEIKLKARQGKARQGKVK